MEWLGGGKQDHCMSLRRNGQKNVVSRKPKLDTVPRREGCLSHQGEQGMNMFVRLSDIKASDLSGSHFSRVVVDSESVLALHSQCLCTR